MTANSEYWILILALLALRMPSAAEARAVPVQEVRLSVDEPIYTGMPVWLKADLRYPYEARYPYSENPSEFGPNRLEVRRGRQALESRRLRTFTASAGVLDGSAAPPGAPVNRLPLHLRYSFDEPGAYSVRWTVVRHHLENGRLVAVVVARSGWLTFEVKQSTPQQREAWLKRQLAAVPDNPGRLAGDFLPSLLAASPDPRALHVFLEQLYSKDTLVSSYAYSSLGLFSPNGLRTQALQLVHRRGLSERMAYLLSGNPLFRDDREDLVRTALPRLRSPGNTEAAAALSLLASLVHARKPEWPANSELSARTDQDVIGLAPGLVERGGDVPQMLALYLAGVRSDAARGILWQLAGRAGPGREQALIMLTWTGDSRDLPRLGEMLLAPGQSDGYGRDVSSLPYALMRGYGDRAIPYLAQAISASPYVFVRTSSAEELALKGRPEAFRFFLDAVQNNRFYKPELVQWLKDHCGLSQHADDEAVVAFLRARLEH